MKLRKLGSMALAAFMAVSLVACSSSGTASSAAGDSAANSESATADSTGKKRYVLLQERVRIHLRHGLWTK